MNQDIYILLSYILCNQQKYDIYAKFCKLMYIQWIYGMSIGPLTI